MCFLIFSRLVKTSEPAAIWLLERGCPFDVKLLNKKALANNLQLYITMYARKDTQSVASSKRRKIDM